MLLFSSPSKRCAKISDGRRRVDDEFLPKASRLLPGRFSVIFCSPGRDSCGPAGRNSTSSFLEQLPTAAIDAFGDEPYDPARMALIWRPAWMRNKLDGQAHGREVVTWGALGWFVVALAGVAAAPPADRAKVQITYTVRMVEAQGVEWREEVYNRLTPVTHQGAATVWTVPRDAARQLLESFSKCPDAKILQAPKVTAFSGVPAAIQCRRNRPVVTQAAWGGRDPGSETDSKTCVSAGIRRWSAASLTRGSWCRLSLRTPSSGPFTM